MSNLSILPDQPAPTLTGRHALFLDFDGTLASLQDDPNTVTLPAGSAHYLRLLSKKFGGALVLISGRGIHDLSLRTPVDLWRAGGHGQDVCPPGMHPRANTGSAPDQLRVKVDAAVHAVEGARVEAKGRVLAVHYRQNPAAGASLAEAMRKLLREIDGYVCQHGKMVIELKPLGVDKGTALMSLMTQLPFVGRIPVMVGDDTTDEDAMAAAMGLGGIAIKVGDGESCAQFRFEDTESVWHWLKEQSDEHA